MAAKTDVKKVRSSPKAVSVVAKTTVFSVVGVT